MAIEPTVAEVLRRVIPSMPNKRALCLGYPDILQLGDPPADEERQAIARWHHWKGGVEHAKHFFASHGITAEYWDVTQARGPERIVDLNAFDHEHVDWTGNGYGFVIDPGTLEHIANIGNCWRTICAVTALNGIVVHANPIGMPNHGFYAINPTCYADIYEANGFKVETMALLAGPLEARKMYDVPRYGRFPSIDGAVMLCVARKVEDVPFTWPVQHKYRVNPTLKREAPTQVMDFAPKLGEQKRSIDYDWDVG